MQYFPPPPPPSGEFMSPDDEGFEEYAVAKLSELLETSDIPLEADDGKTQDLLSKIADQIDKLRDTNEEEEDTKLSTRKKAGEGAKPLELPQYPTHFEVWKSKHRDIDDYKPPVYLREDEWAELVDRLNMSGKRKHMLLMRAQHKQIADELSGLSFKPKINRRSRELARQVEQLPDRLEHLLRFRKDRLNRIRHEKEHSELSTATFKPDLKSPCICGLGKGLRDSTPSELSKHTKFCLNFMKACESSNKSSRMQQISDRMNRGVDDLTKYATDKKARAERTRQYFQEVEDRELTFSPQISRNSLRICERLARQGGRTPKKEKKAESPEKPAVLVGHEEETFIPQINERSKRLCRTTDGQDVHNRLYVHALERLEKQNLMMEKVTPNLVDAKTPNLQGSSDTVNIVRYKPEYDFLLRRLEVVV